MAADYTKAARQLLSEHPTSKRSDNWKLLVLQLPEDSTEPESADAGCEHAPESLPETASRTQEICRRLRQLADDLEAVSEDSDG